MSSVKPVRDIIGTDDYIYCDIKPVFDSDIMYDYERVYDVEAVRQSLLNLFLVQKYEVPGKPEFGNPLDVQVFDLFDTFSEDIIKTNILNVVERYDPRILIEKIEITETPELNRLIVAVYYYVYIDNKRIGDTIYIPYAHNTRSFVGNRGISSGVPKINTNV